MITDGDEASTILETASAENVDLIVMTTHGRTGLTRWVLGSVTERVLHDAPCPVLVMRTSTPLQKVLITLDGSVIAEYALEPGLAVARALDAQVRLLAVADSGHFDLVASAEIEEAVTKERPHRSAMNALRWNSISVSCVRTVTGTGQSCIRSCRWQGGCRHTRVCRGTPAI